MLVALYAAFVAHSWLAWGDVDTDCGREMYVPLRLLEGDVLYRDIRYPYGPFSAYLHMLGYQLWRPHLAVLYADGIATTALVLAVLYDIARALGGPSTAALTVALVMMDLVFIPGEGAFSFIFPYAYPALHGLLFLLTCLAGALRLLAGGGPITALLAGAGAGLALLAKPEFGVTSLAVILATSAGLALRGSPRLARRLVLLWAPTLLLPALGYGLLATTMPPATIVQRGLFAPEYFEGSHVIAWKIAGLLPHVPASQNAAVILEHWATSVPLYVPGLAVAALAGALALPFARRPTGSRLAAPLVGLLAAGAVWTAYWVSFPPTWLAPFVSVIRGRYALLPPLLAGVLLVSSSTLVRQVIRGQGVGVTTLRYWLLSAVGLALLIRVPANLVPGSYANFFLPIGIVLFVHLVVDRLPTLWFIPPGSRTAVRAAAGSLLAGLALFVGVCRWQMWSPRDVEIATDRGTLRLYERPHSVAFRQALDWVREHASPGATLLSLPRGTALSFLSGHGNSLYETSTVVTAETAAQEGAYIAALERDPPDLIVTSAIAQPEYGLGAWGIESNRSIQQWIAGAYTATDTVRLPGYGVMTFWVRRTGSPDDRARRGLRGGTEADVPIGTSLLSGAGGHGVATAGTCAGVAPCSVGR